MRKPNAYGPFATLNLPRAIFAQAGKLLQAIAAASTPADVQRSADRGEGFVLGLETVKALSPVSLEVMYQGFEAAARARQLELEQ